MSNSKLEVFLIVLPIFIGSLTLHELAHGWVAYRLGDPTAKLLGRLSLNPIVHLEPLGSLMFVASYWAGGFLFGWAKPVPVDPRNLRLGPQRGMALVGIAGPDHELPARDPVRRDPRAHDLHGHDRAGDRLRHVREHRARRLQPAADPAARRVAHRRGLHGSADLRAWSSLDQYGMVILLVLFFVFQGPFQTLLQSATTDVSTVISDIVGGQPFRL